MERGDGGVFSGLSSMGSDVVMPGARIYTASLAGVRSSSSAYWPVLEPSLGCTRHSWWCVREAQLEVAPSACMPGPCMVSTRPLALSDES